MDCSKKVYYKILGPLDIRPNGNIIKNSYFGSLYRIISGVYIFDRDVNQNRVVVAEVVSIPGCLSFFLWLKGFLYSAIVSVIEDQSIIRTNFDTKLQRYGDKYSRIISIGYVTYLTWMIPFHIGKGEKYYQVFLDADVALGSLAEDYLEAELSGTTFILAILQMGFIIIHSVCNSYSQVNIPSENKPHELMFFTVYRHAFAMVLVTDYYYYLHLIKRRVQIILNALAKIGDPETKPDVESKNLIRSCAVAAGKLEKAVQLCNQLYGIPLACTFLVCLMTITLNMFYFAEASSVLSERRINLRYGHLLTFLFYEALYSMFIIFICIHSAEELMALSKKISRSLLELSLKNDETSPIFNVLNEFTKQLQHQRFNFSANRLFDLNYRTLMGAIRYMCTVQLLLLRTAIDTKQLPALFQPIGQFRRTTTTTATTTTSTTVVNATGLVMHLVTEVHGDLVW